MTKEIKKILIISDDFETDYFVKSMKKQVGSGNYYYSKRKNIFKFNIDLSESFKNLKVNKYDAILIDYGLIGGNEEETAIELMREAMFKEIPLAWCGGLAERYNDDAKEIFPKLRFLHNLPSCHIGHNDILGLLYSLFIC